MGTQQIWTCPLENGFLRSEYAQNILGKVHKTKPTAKQIVVVVVGLSRNNEILAICLGRDDTDGVFVSRADVPSTGSNKRRWSIYPSFPGRKFQTFSPPKFFLEIWKSLRFQWSRTLDNRLLSCNIYFWISKCCSIIVNNPCTLDSHRQAYFHDRPNILLVK